MLELGQQIADANFVPLLDQHARDPARRLGTHGGLLSRFQVTGRGQHGVDLAGRDQPHGVDLDGDRAGQSLLKQQVSPARCQNQQQHERED